jgi:hypothetical protein
MSENQGFCIEGIVLCVVSMSVACEMAFSKSNSNNM